ncbi:MAG: cell division control protein Cdc6 [Nitrososphaeraceae archaeon]|nr:cell division control protein Cdc6 [Nitrososphaeraceae archaeon]
MILSDNNIVDEIFNNILSGKSLIKNRRALTIDYVPDKLQFRDEETKTIAQTLSVALKGSRPSNLLLFGKPGTGKTAVVKYVIDNFIKKASKMKMNIHVPFINTKFANTAYKVLFEIAEDMQINKAGKEYQVYFTGLSLGEATDRILEYIKQQQLHVILVLDEIDSLVDKNGDDILYNFTRANERITEGGFISLIGISNSLTFKDKLDPRVRSSLSEEELIFNPYKINQLQKILSERIVIAFYENTVTDGAINLCAAMAGKENGDARKAIDLLRVAAEIAELNNKDQVTEDDIRSAQYKIEKDTNNEIIKNSTTHTKIIILAILKSKQGNTGDVYDIYSRFCLQTENEPLTQRRVTQIISELDQLGIITTNIINQGRYGRSQKIKLTISTATIKEALKDDVFISPLVNLIDQYNIENN